jgi:phosphopantetheinyl transferase
MAARGGMDHLLTSKGIDLLPVDFAVQQSIAMLEHRFLGEVIVAGSLGSLPMPSTQPLVQYATLGPHGIHGHTTFNPIDSKWLQDHSIGDTPIFPGVMGLELMAQSISTIQPKQIHSIEQVNFERPIKFHRNQSVDFEVTTQFHPDKVDCTLYSVRKLAGNRTQKTLHFTATMRVVSPLTTSLLSEEPLQPCTVSSETIYRQFFHGPSFQVLESVSSMSTKESISTGILDHMSILPSHNISPLAIESAFQAAGWHHWTQTQEMVLPKSIESLQIFDLPTDWEGLTMRAQPVLNKPRTYNVDVFQNHSIVMTLRNLEFIEAPPTSNNEKDFWTPEPDVVIARSQENLQILPSNDRMTIQSRGSLKRQQDRLAGRTAAYRLLRKEGITSQVLQETSGKPFLQDSSADISISHSNGIGWAALNHNGRIGIDVEQIEERSSAFLRDWFTEGEQRLCEENTSETKLLHTIVWTIKEALSKLLGTGFRIHPKCFEVQSINRELQTCTVQFHNEAYTQWVSLNPAGSLQCRWINLDTEILSFVTVVTPKVRSIC